jgi:hypothetical protein
MFFQQTLKLLNLVRPRGNSVQNGKRTFRKQLDALNRTRYFH